MNFPTSNMSEIPLWLVLQAHSPKANLGGGGGSEDDILGETVGDQIALQAPQQMVLGDSHNYNTINMKAMMGGLDLTTDIKSGDIGAAFSDVWSAMKTLGADIPVIGKVAESINYINSQAINPREEIVFSKPNFRSMNFSWEFGISEVEDYESLDKIINHIRKHSYPTIADAFLYTMPSQWMISLVQQIDGGTPQWWEFGKCVLESMSTNFTGAGMLTASDVGKPNFINLELAFKEVKLRSNPKSGQGTKIV